MTAHQNLCGGLLRQTSACTATGW